MRSQSSAAGGTICCKPFWVTWVTRSFKEPVVVWGSAGAGKSTFTLRLAVELLREGLIPIRVRISRLRTDLPLLNAIHEAIVNTPGLFVPGQFAKPQDVLLGGNIFDDATKFRDATISRYVLILDGWDEISAGDKSYHAEVSKFLDKTRNTMLSRSNPPVRVVLTGRPSDAVTSAAFLDDSTPILTMRAYTVDQLSKYLLALKTVAEKQPRLSGRAFDSIVKRLIKRYSEEKSKRYEVLSQPLLAYLTFQVAMECEKEEQIAALLENPTNLYRRLLDLTCNRAGKADPDPDGDSSRQVRIRGQALRSMLRRAATAITTLGEECISFDELQPRARFSETETAKLTESPYQDRPWTSLILSFFFKAGGEQHGLEFLHKSFREYLYAEAVVESIKEHAARQKRAVIVRPMEAFDQDFPAGDAEDQRYPFSRALCEIICSPPLTDEIQGHISTLLRWEIERASAGEKVHEPVATDPIKLEEWWKARDLLTEVWGWWLSRTASRVQMKKNAMTGWTEMSPPYVGHLIESAAQRNRRPGNLVPAPPSGIGIDGVVGFGLLFITVELYRALQQQQGWEGDWLEAEETESAYSTQVVSAVGKVRAFRPAPVSNPGYLRIAMSRFEAGDLSSAPMFKASLAGTDLRGADLVYQPMILTDFTDSNLNEADLSGCILENAIFRNAKLRDADFFSSYLELANFTRAELHGAKLGRVFGLKSTVIAEATGNALTTLPEGVERPEHWEK